MNKKIERKRRKYCKCFNPALNENDIGFHRKEVLHRMNRLGHCSSKTVSIDVAF